MREWDEITRDVLRRRDEKIAQKKAQIQMVKRKCQLFFIEQYLEV